MGEWGVRGSRGRDESFIHEGEHHIYDCQVQIPCISHLHPYPIYTGTHRTLRSCTLEIVNMRLPKILSLPRVAFYAWGRSDMSAPEMPPRCRGETPSYGRPPGGKCRRAAKRPATALLSNRACVAGCHGVRTTALSALPHGRALDARSYAYERISIHERSERRFARALCMVSRERRSRSHVRELERQLAPGPTHGASGPKHS